MCIFEKVVELLLLQTKAVATHAVGVYRQKAGVLPSLIACILADNGLGCHKGLALGD